MEFVKLKIKAKHNYMQRIGLFLVFCSFSQSIVFGANNDKPRRIGLSIGLKKEYALVFPERGVMTGRFRRLVPFNTVSVGIQSKKNIWRISYFYGENATHIEPKKLMPGSYGSRTISSYTAEFGRLFQKGIYIYGGISYANLADEYLEDSAPQVGIYIYSKDFYSQLRIGFGAGYKYSFLDNLLFFDINMRTDYPFYTHQSVNNNPNATTIISGSIGFGINLLRVK
ncbi:MAG: hypothetical protein GC180_08570 [Bacteroidetes bacterium]|nr:hypothetical protein [Bacteroidota bacterium]